jgi:hypothetical protein
MTIAGKIQGYVKRFPTSSQTAVLDFAQFLFKKAQSQGSRVEELAWSDLSLTDGMRGTENEDTIKHTIFDVNVLF